MSDDEQIRLLTEIRDALREQAAWERDYVKKRGTSMIILFFFFIVMIAFGFFMGIRHAERQVNEIQNINNPGR
jgi:hypothetical protein